VNLYLECIPDEALAMCLGVPRKRITHQNDKGRVCNRLEKSRDALGMIDEDPQSAQPAYLKKLERKESNHRLTVWEETGKNNRVIIICPRLEEWLLQTAREAAVDTRHFGLPDNAKDLHKVIHFKLDQLKQLLYHLEERQNRPILYLKSLLNS
jgi:hypothetical protein